MPAKKKTTRSPKPAMSAEAREKQLESAAFDLAEQQLREGTASPSVITHFLKLASTREQIERKALAAKADLATAKAEDIKSSKRNEEIATEALNAMKAYSGQSTADNHE